MRPCHGPATTGVVRQLNSSRMMRVLIVQCYRSLRHMDDSGTGPPGRVLPSGPGALPAVRRRDAWMAESWRCAVPVAPRSAVRVLCAAAVSPCHSPATTGVVRQLSSSRMMRVLILQCNCILRHMDESGTGAPGRVPPSGPGPVRAARPRESWMAESWLCSVPGAPRSAVRALWAAAVRPCHGTATTGVVR